MKKITQKQITELAKKALERGNPYIERAIEYRIGKTPMYLYAGETMSREAIDEAYVETASKDIKWGYEQRGVGYYDKWYRYNRADEGRAYDLGVRLAAGTVGCRDDLQIIPCLH
jgi:predicted aldo/keto reductase-like oxidoreductase